jgi:hypothetical protein
MKVFFFFAGSKRNTYSHEHQFILESLSRREACQDPHGREARCYGN